MSIAGHQPFTPDWKPGWLGWARDDRHQGTESTGKIGNIWLSVVEFDDQGRCYSRHQLHSLMSQLDQWKSRNPIIICFAHGWKHNGSSADSNLNHFVHLLECAASLAGARPVHGVFLAWRGLSFHDITGFFTSLFTFLSRKAAALRVAMGAPRELLERLRKFKEDELGNATLIIIGHSFGGLVVYNALAQSLIRSAITPADKSKIFANLVLLVNPAFEGVRYLPVHDLVREQYDICDTAHGNSQPPQDDHGLPTFVCVTAKNDWATGLAFPVGMALTWLRERPKRKKERQSLIHTMGHIDFMRTHTLSLKNAAGHTMKDAQAVRTRFDAANPYWVMAATPDIVDGHTKIWKPHFRNWVESLLTRHL